VVALNKHSQGFAQDQIKQGHAVLDQRKYLDIEDAAIRLREMMGKQDR
jgi:hypothetical protein